jgi:hypothetical protein
VAHAQTPKSAAEARAEEEKKRLEEDARKR